jgi:PAS domain S-box-containing protein
VPTIPDGPNLLDALEPAAILTDLAATIVYWNRAAESLYGWAREEAIGHPVFDVTPTMASRQQGEDSFEAVRLGRRWSGEYPVQREDSTTFLAHVTLPPVYDNQGLHVGVLGLSEDADEARARHGPLPDPDPEHRFHSEDLS